MNDRVSTPDLSSFWYECDQDGRITYTNIGLSVYRPLFEKAGVDIENVETLQDHKEAIARAKPGGQR